MMAVNWRPTKSELEMIADMATARLPNERIAATLGVDLEAFVIWALRAARAVEQEPERQPPAISEPLEPQTPRIVAERMFAGE